MSTVVELVNSAPVHGGVSDGYRRAQLGNPVSSAGQAPQFRGARNTPGESVSAPNILSSAARQNQGTNVIIPYTRVVPADELLNKGRLSPGDVAFISRFQYGITGQTKKNQLQASQVTSSVSTAHASISRLAGLDYINRALDRDNYYPGKTVLVNSENPLDDWRSLTFLNEWTVDGLVMSNDEPNYITDCGAGSRNDQLFNIGIQGPVQVNNGYNDGNGNGMASSMDSHRARAAGSVSVERPKNTNVTEMNQLDRVRALIAGPFYNMYPLQMFDRKVRPGDELYIGLAAQKIQDAAKLEELKRLKPGLFDVDSDGQPVRHVHVFRYACFSSRQAYQFATRGVDAAGRPDPASMGVRNDPNYDIVDTGMQHRRDSEINAGEAEPAYLRRGPNSDLKRKRAEDSENTYDFDFLGLSGAKFASLVGAWRLGRVLDKASKRGQSYSGGPIDTAFSLTVNFDLRFSDWRCLRRELALPLIGMEHSDTDLEWNWDEYDVAKSKFKNDDGTVLLWPTAYTIYDEKVAAKDNANIPINPLNPDYVPTFDRDEKDQRTGVSRTGVRNTVAEQRNAYAQAVEKANKKAASPPTPENGRTTESEIVNESSVESAFQRALPAFLPTPASPLRSAVKAPAAASSAAPVRTQPTQKTPAASPARPVPKAPVASAPANLPAKASGKALAKAPAQIAAPAAAAVAGAGVLGDDVMASIFGSSTPMAASGTGGAPESRGASDDSVAPKSKFPRRNRDR